MTLQRRLLLLMLASLGVAALTGVLAVLGGSSEILGRLALSGLWFAIGLGIALATSRWLRRESTQRAAVLSLSLLALTVLTAFAATWIELLGGGSRLTGELAGTGFLLLLAGQAAAIMIGISAQPAMRIAAKTGALIVALGAVPMAIMIWGVFSGWQTEGKLVGMAFATWGTIIPLGACLSGWPSRTLPWRWIGVAAVGIGWPLAMYGIWNDTDEKPWVIVQCCIVAVVVGLSVVAQFPSVTGGWIRMRLVSVVSAFVSAGFFTWLNLLTSVWERNSGRSGDEFLETRLGGVFGIVAVAGTAALFIVDRLQRRPSGVSVKDLGGIDSIAVTCPRCTRQQPAPIGASRCVGCGVVITVGISEPRCPQCDYALMDMLGDKCPECGIDLPERGKAMVIPAKV